MFVRCILAGCLGPASHGAGQVPAMGRHMLSPMLGRSRLLVTENPAPLAWLAYYLRQDAGQFQGGGFSHPPLAFPSSREVWIPRCCVCSQQRWEAFLPRLFGVRTTLPRSPEHPSLEVSLAEMLAPVLVSLPREWNDCGRRPGPVEMPLGPMAPSRAQRCRF